MPSYHRDYNPAPWADLLHSNSIYYIVIEDGITNIGQYAFAEGFFYGITIPKSVTSIEQAAFDGSSLIYARYYGTQADWENLSFEHERNDALTLEKISFCSVCLDRIIDTPYYTLTLPENWLGKCVAEISQIGNDLYCFNIREKISAEKNYPGSVFSLYIAEQDKEFFGPGSQVIDSFCVNETEYNLWLILPPDFDVAREGVQNYRLMCDSTHYVLDSIQFKEVTTGTTGDNAMQLYIGC